MLRLFGFVKQETPLIPQSRRVQVYCQTCGRELTDIGGEVTDAGRIYCSPNPKSGEDCAMIDLNRHPLRDYWKFAAPRTPVQIQEAVQTGALTHYHGRSRTSIELNLG